MTLLAIETSGFAGSVALLHDADLTERSLGTAGRRHAQTLVLEIQRLLQSRGLQPGDIDVVAVSVGPGSFTGLRVGVVCAKTFAWANDCRLVAVDTLQATAHRLSDVTRTVRVLMDAQRSEVFVNDFCWDSATGLWTPSAATRIEPVADVAKSSQNVVLTGAGLQKFDDEFPAEAERAARERQLPTAATVARIGQIEAERQVFAELATLEPVYIRRSYAEEKAAARS